MGLGDGLASQDCGTEGARERVTGADGIGHFNLGGLLEGHLAAGEDIGAVGATGEHEHVEVILAQDQPALVLDVQSGIAEHATDGHQFLIVDLENVATAHRLLDNLLVVELLAQVDVKDLHAVAGRGVEEPLDVLSRDDVALSQRAVAHGAAVGCDLLNLGREGDVVPCHVLLDVIGGDSLLVERHLHGAGGIGHARHEVLEAMLVEGLDGLLGEFVLTQGADGDSIVAAQELPGMIGEVGGGTAQFLTFGENVPQGLAQAHYIAFVHILFLSFKF